MPNITLSDILVRIQELEIKFHREPFSYTMELIKSAKVELAIFILARPDLVALLKSHEAKQSQLNDSPTLPKPELEGVHVIPDSRPAKGKPGRPKKVK